jgi:hypothetical protein
MVQFYYNALEPYICVSKLAILPGTLSCASLNDFSKGSCRFFHVMTTLPAVQTCIVPICVISARVTASVNVVWTVR